MDGRKRDFSRPFSTIPVGRAFLLLTAVAEKRKSSRAVACGGGRVGWCAAGSGRAVAESSLTSRSVACCGLARRASGAGRVLSRSEGEQSGAGAGRAGTRVWGAEPSFCSGNRLCQSRCGSAPSRANDAPVFPESSLADELPHRMQIWYRDNGFGFGVQNWHQSRRFGTLKPLKNLSKEPKVTTNVHLTLELL